MSPVDRLSVWRRSIFWLERHHGWKSALTLALVVSAIPWLAGFVVGGPASACLTEEQYRSVDEAISEIATIAQIMGGVYAILLAVVVFSVQLHAQREDESALMVRYLIRRHGVYWISALAVGVTLSNALAPIFHTFGWRFSLLTILALDIALVPLSLAMSLWLLYVTIRDATLPTFDSTFDTFKRDMTRAIAVDQYNADLITTFTERLKPTRMEYNAFSGWSSREREWRAEFVVPEKQYIEDIDLDAIRELNHLLRHLPGDCKLQFSLAPGEVSDSSPCFVIRCDRQKGDAKADPPAAKLLTEDFRKQIDALVRRVFVTGVKSVHVSDDLNEFLKRLRDRLVALAKDGDAVRFATAIDRLESLVRHWSGLATDTEPGTTSLWRSNPGQLFAGPLAVDLRDVIVKCMESGDRDKAEAMLMFLASLFSEGVRVGHFRLTSDAAWLIPLAYYFGTLNEKISGRVSTYIDGSIDILMHPFTARRASWDRAGEGKKSRHRGDEQVFLERGVAMVLALIRTALQRGDKDDAENFTDRLFSHLRYEHPYQPNETAILKEDGDALHVYAMIVLIGWSLHILQSKKPECAEAAESVLSFVKKRLPSREQVVAVWELYHHQSSERAAVDESLGVAHWEFPETRTRRSGVVYSVSRREWLPQGFYAAALIAESIHAYSEGKFFSTAPFEYLWRSEHDRRELNTAAELTWLGIQAGEKEQRVSEVAALLLRRERAARVAHIERIAKQTIDPQKRAAVVQNVRERATQKPPFEEMIETVGIGPSSVTPTPLPKIIVTQAIPFSSITSEALGGDTGTWIGEELVGRHNVELQKTIAAVSPSDTPIKSLVDLPTAVEAAIRDMVQRGLTPNVVFIPWEPSIGAALLQRPHWQFDVDEGLQVQWSCGRWHGLHVVKLGRELGTSVIIVDTRQFFGRPEDATCDVTLVGPDPTQIAEIRRQASTATTADQVPDPDEIQVNVHVELTPHLGVMNPVAAVAVDTAHAIDGYAMLPRENVYHRARCQLVKHHDDVTFSRAKRLESDTTERTPCLQCMPDSPD